MDMMKQVFDNESNDESLESGNGGKKYDTGTLINEYFEIKKGLREQRSLD